jgi:hypothetical protein
VQGEEFRLFPITRNTLEKMEYLIAVFHVIRGAHSEWL